VDSAALVLQDKSVIGAGTPAIPAEVITALLLALGRRATVLSAASLSPPRFAVSPAW
jgi:hypothetical protein